jgi:hypothetical protein
MRSQEGIGSSFDARFERGQHAFGSHRRFGPAPTGLDLSVLCSRCRHCRRSFFLGCQRPASISLRPFAPPALPGFTATMDALTPVRLLRQWPWFRSVPSLVSALSGDVANGHQTVLRPFRQQPCPNRSPCVMARTFRPFRRQPPLAARRSRSGFVTSAYRRSLRQGEPRPFGPCVIWASPLASRLAAATGRIAFVMILRTSRSPPVAPHPASRRRSYVRLRGSDPTSARTSTSRIQDTYKRTSPAIHGGVARCNSMRGVPEARLNRGRAAVQPSLRD